MAVLYGIQCLPLVCVCMRGRHGDKQSVFNFLSLVNCSRLTLQWKFGMVSWNWQEKYQKIFFLFSCRVLFWGRECCDRVQQHTYAPIPSVSYSSPPKIIPSKKKKKKLCAHPLAKSLCLPKNWLWDLIGLLGHHLVKPLWLMESRVVPAEQPSPVLIIQLKMCQEGCSHPSVG